MNATMNAERFSLGTFRLGDRKPFVALVAGETAIELVSLHARYLTSARASAGHLETCASLLEILEDWDRHFAVLQAMHGFAREEGADAFVTHALAALRPLPPVTRPSKILNCAANYSGHLAEMRQYTLSGGNVDPASIYKGDKSTAQPYLFLKAPSSLVGAFDDIVLPGPDDQIDWEAELGVVIGAPARRVSAERAIEHVAGFMNFNDVSCRNVLFRTDRPNFRTDWLSSKSFDTFGPCGPFFVPRAFVPQHGALRIQLRVNGEVKQDGLAGDMIYSPEEQIEYASRMMTLVPGDLFATGTLGGVGQGTGKFLKAGDLVETEVEGLGVQRNRIVAG